VPVYAFNDPNPRCAWWKQGAGVDSWRASNAVFASAPNAGVPHNRWSLSETGSVANPTKEAVAHGVNKKKVRKTVR
jgi:hypothetical protein